MNHRIQQKNILTNDEQAANALEFLREALGNMAQLRGSLSSLQKSGFALMPESRTIKIQRDIKTNEAKKIEYVVPALRLCGKWLEAAGFLPDQQVRIIALDQLLIICPEEGPKQLGKLRRMV
jgi:hypothetical protein